MSSYPKSGATWFRFLSYAAINGEIKRSLDVGDFYPEIFPDGSQDKTIISKIENNEIFLAKTHLPYQDTMPFQESITDVIYIVRNPFDSIVSRLNHYLLDGGSNLNIENILNSLIDEANKSGEELGIDRSEGGWNYHVKSWIKNNKV